MNIKNIIIAISGLFIALLSAGCAANDEPIGPPQFSDEAVRFLVAPPPEFASGDIETRTSITTTGANAGKISWSLNDVIYVGIRFKNASNDVINTRQFKLTYQKKTVGAGNEWVANELIIWPSVATRADVTATYIGTAQPGELTLDHEVYVHKAENILPVETLSLNNFQHRLNIYVFTSLLAGDKVTIKGNGLARHELNAEDYFDLKKAEGPDLANTVAAGKTSTRIVTSNFTPQNCTFSVERAGKFLVKDKNMGLKTNIGQESTIMGYYYTFKITEAVQGPTTPDKIGQ